MKQASVSMALTVMLVPILPSQKEELQNVRTVLDVQLVRIKTDHVVNVMQVSD